MVTFFIFYGKSNAKTPFPIVINEILINGLAGEEFVELYNDSDESAFLDGWYFAYYSPARNWSSPYRKKAFPAGTEIKAHSYYVIGFKGYGKANWQPYTSDQLGNAAGSVAIFSNNTFSESNAIDAVSWGKVEYVKEKSEAKIPTQGKSIGRDGAKDTNENNVDFSEQEITPGEKNKLTELAPTPVQEKLCSEKIVLSEIHPFTEEFVEVKNEGSEKCSLENWAVADSANHKKSFGSVLILAQGYAYVSGNLYLNDDGDTANLIDLNGKIIESVAYEKHASGFSYAKFSDGWNWTNVITRGLENAKSSEAKSISGIFDIKMDEDVYANVYAHFSVEGLDESAKVVWNFGDDHKSYLKSTKHKFEKEGDYQGILKVTENGESNAENFSIKVTSYPHPKVRIVAINANPKGSDENETITIKNQSKKKVNLNGWSIATGAKKKLTNHPINADIVIKKGKEKEVTREQSKFTLNNKKGKIELRYPDGEVASKVKYDSRKGVQDDELYVKVKGGWAWQNTKQETITNKQNTKNNQETIINNQIMRDEQNVQDEEVVEEEVLGVEEKKEIDFAKFKNEDFVTIEFLKQENKNPKFSVYELNGHYFFTPQGRNREHYAVVFLKNMLLGLNVKINAILN